MTGIFSSREEIEWGKYDILFHFYQPFEWLSEINQPFWPLALPLIHFKMTLLKLKNEKIKSLGLCDTSNLCGALEFAEKISKSGTQPIIGTQINFKFADTIGLIPLFALNEDGYKRIIELSSLSYLDNDQLSEPHLNFDELLNKNKGVAIFSGTVHGLFGELFNKGKFNVIKSLYSKLKLNFQDQFYIEIQRHGDVNEKEFEKLNLSLSLELEIPVIATNEVFYLNNDMIKYLFDHYF